MTDDAILIAGLRAGRPGAARALYDAYGPGLYAFARRRTGDPQLAREIVQDVMVSVWRSASRFDPEIATLRTWMFQIARNATIDAGRRQSRRPRLVREEQPPEGPQAAGDHDADIESMFRTWLVRTALDRLGPDHRAVVELVYFGHLKVTEAAEVLGIAEGTVKSRCFYAVQALRAAFEELGVIDGDL